MIERAFNNYKTAVETLFKANQNPRSVKGLIELSNKADQLRALVEKIEGGDEFSGLVDVTRLAFCNDWHKGKSDFYWRHAIQNFFRRSGFYTDVFKNWKEQSNLVERYKTAFQRRKIKKTYLVPMEFVRFSKPDFNFQGFDIHQFSKEKIDDILGNDINAVFFPYASVDTHALHHYWFIMITVEKEARRLGLFPLDFNNIDLVATEYSSFPKSIQRVLERLILFNWVVDEDKDHLPYGNHFGFNIPFVIEMDDDDLNSPRLAPDCSKLETVPRIDHFSGDEYEERIVFFDLDEAHVDKFRDFISHIDDCLFHIETDPNRYFFLKLALEILTKAFFAKGLEQLLWHITTLEALLGERKEGVTAILATRIAAVLATTNRDKKEIKKQFNKLYELRCNLVHGNTFKKGVQLQKLFDARMMAQRVTIWFVHYLSEIAVKINNGVWQGDFPKREDLLHLLDLNEADRSRLIGLLCNLSDEFPAAPAWSDKSAFEDS